MNCKFHPGFEDLKHWNGFAFRYSRKHGLFIYLRCIVHVHLCVHLWNECNINSGCCCGPIWAHHNLKSSRLTELTMNIFMYWRESRHSGTGIGMSVISTELTMNIKRRVSPEEKTKALLYVSSVLSSLVHCPTVLSTQCSPRAKSVYCIHCICTVLEVYPQRYITQCTSAVQCNVWYKCIAMLIVKCRTEGFPLSRPHCPPYISWHRHNGTYS